MAPARGRIAQEDSKSDVMNIKDKPYLATNRMRKNGALSTVQTASTTDSNAPPEIHTSTFNMGPTDIATATGNGIFWPSEEISLLHAYRAGYHVQVPSAFRSPLSAAVLCVPGMGRRSPTMARKREKRKVGKEQLAHAVRRHFNGLAVNETDVIVDFLYKVKFQDQSFKMRFAPPDRR